MPAASDKSELWAWPPGGVPGRNQTFGFATRTRENLDYILDAHERHEDVHVVTQVVLSLLGIVVFPFEKAIKGAGYQWPLAELGTQGWPTWTYLEGTVPSDLTELIKNLRHATAHNNIQFSSDSRYLHEVTITFTNRPPQRNGGGTWRASIRGDDLVVFCRQALNLLEGITG